METTPLDSQDELSVLRALVAEQAAKLESQEAEVIKRDSIIDLLRAQLELLRHRQHGASSKKIDRKIEQFELMLEEVEASRAEAELRSGKAPLPELDDAPDKPKRKPLPDGLPTEELVYAAPCNCPTCGGTSFLKAADRVVQVLEHVPASVKIVRHVEKRLICRECDTTVAGEIPTLPIERSKPGPGLLAHIMVAKFDDHIPLYRLSEMYDRLGIDISRSVMGDWVGRVSVLLAPLILAIRAHIAAVDRIHTDDTPVDVLDPGRGKTKTGRVWVYVFDGSGYQDPTPGAIAYYYSPDRKGVHPADHLVNFSGMMHADGYGGYKKLYGNQIIEAACMAHVRRKFHDVIKLKPSPIADEALSRIGALYDIEDRIRGMSAEERRTLRQQHARPILANLKSWIEEVLSTLPQKQKLAEAMRYALSRWAALSVYIDDGRVEIDNNIAERAMRPLGIGRKNWLFAGSDKGGERIANILTIIETRQTPWSQSRGLSHRRPDPDPGSPQEPTWGPLALELDVSERPMRGRVMAGSRFIYTLKEVAGMIGENLELIEEVTANSDNIAERELVYVRDRSEDGTTGLTEDGIEDLRNLLADMRTWDGGIRQFLLDEQCDPEMIERVMADELKRAS